MWRDWSDGELVSLLVYYQAQVQYLAAQLARASRIPAVILASEKLGRARALVEALTLELAARVSWPGVV